MGTVADRQPRPFRHSSPPLRIFSLSAGIMALPSPTLSRRWG
ncbi:hypothetical protein ACFFX0_31055 [Citricoccus parietis]|uniref:Uncharacterized protein n=1 Tax=Citricoccus parietis TaxID=592307 RepID=A0ABV5G9Q3_9MICC